MWTPRRFPEACALALAAVLAAGVASPLVAQQAPAAPAPAAAAPATKPSARDFVTKVVGEIANAIKDRSQPSAARRQKIETLVHMWLDAETISKLTLARHWKTFNEAQQKEFVLAFRDHLVLTYYRNVDRYAFERIDVYEDHAENKGDWTVRTKVIAPNAGDVLIDLRVRPTADGTDWKVIDIFIEGVSLVTNFRSQFQEVLTDGTPDQLLASLRDKNAATRRKYEEAEAGAAPGG